MIKSSFLLTSLILFSLTLFSQTTVPAFDWDQFNKEAISIGNLHFSPDGNILLYSTRKADFDDNQWETEYHLLDLKTKDDMILSLKPENARAVKWSPSGQYISYLAIKNGKSQVFIQEYPDGPAKAISNHSTSISRFSWSHDESKIAFIAKDEIPEKNASDIFITAFEVGPQGYLIDQPFLSSHLYVLDVENETMQRLTEGNWSIASDVSWSTDDQELVFTRKEDAYTSRWNNTEIMRYDLASESISPFSEKKRFESSPEFTPNKGQLLYKYKTDENPAGITDLYIKEEGKTPVNLSATLDRNIKGYQWTGKKNELLLYGPDGTTDGVWLLSSNGEFEKAGFSNKFVISDLDINKRGEIALVASSGNNPPEIYFLKEHNAKVVPLTKYNKAFKEIALGQVETFTWETDLNITTTGVVTYPPDFDSEKKYPLVLVIHGGPTASSMESFSATNQFMASQGWIVFQPNYRGSNNLGDAYQEAIMNDGGEGPGRDVMAGVEALTSRGYVDESRIAVSGWSYGGFMTAWLIGRYPDFWKAAVAGAAPVDYTDMTSLTSMNLTLRHAITNSPWVGDNYQVHYEMSPIKNLPKIKTPTLIMSKVEDQIVSVTGSYKLYHALRANNIPTKFIAYPGGGHFPYDPVNRKDVFDRWVAWLKVYL